MSQIKSFLKRLVPSGPGFIVGAATAGIIYVGNHVLHVHVAAGSVESAITPVAAFLAASIADGVKLGKPKLEAAVKAEVAVVESDVTKVIHKVDPSSKATGASLADLVTKAITAKLASDPGLEDELVKTALGHLTSGPLAPVLNAGASVVKAVEADEPAPPAPPVTLNAMPTGPVQTPSVLAPSTQP